MSYRQNEQIDACEVRVVDQYGQMRGVMPTDQARRLALAAGLDLVEIAPREPIPVCRIMDYEAVRFELREIIRRLRDGGQSR